MNTLYVKSLVVSSLIAGIAGIAGLLPLQSYAQNTPYPYVSPTPTPTYSPGYNPGSAPGASQWNIKTTTGAYGEYLTDNAGKSLYLYQADSPGTSTCYGACAQAWPPLLAPPGQSYSGSGNVQSSLLGTTSRTDGSTQVTYKGWPLYYYAPDQNPGETKGQAILDYGANWYLVKPDGSALR